MEKEKVQFPSTLKIWQASKVKNFYFLLVVFSFSFFLFNFGRANAASLSFSPSSGSYAVGKTFSVSVYVSSADQAMNAASGVILFPHDKLEVTSLSKSGSVFTLWVQEPSFSNSNGTVNLEGIVLNPGFTGSSGKIITASFRVKAAGVATLSFSSGSILANDGAGTNILTTLGSAQFSLGGATAPPSISPPAGTALPQAPKISSSTHPDSNKWYALGDAKFTWPLPSGTTGVRLLVGSIPQATPSVSYIPAISQKDVTQLADGVWYFHAQLRNANGWGEVSHFRFQIDTTKPSRFEITEVKRDDLTDPRVKFTFDARDETSGIDYYEVNINGEKPEIWKDDGSHTYITPILGWGKHTLIAKAIDNAGNSLVNSAEFTIQALQPPKITEYPRTIQRNEILIVKGTTLYPNAHVTIWLAKDKEEPKSKSVTTGENGNFTFVDDEKLDSGVYTLWADVADERNLKSGPSEKVTIGAQQSELFLISSWIIDFLTLAIPLIALIMLLVIVSWYAWHKFMILKRKVRKEVYEAEQTLHQGFDLLREAVRKQIKILEKTKTKRELTSEEEKIINQLKKDLGYAEKFMRKEIEDIDEAVK